MRFKKEPEKLIKKGSWKLERKFAFFPVYCEYHEEYVWLETYYKLKRFENIKYVGNFWWITWHWGWKVKANLPYKDMYTLAEEVKIIKEAMPTPERKI